MQRMAPAPIVVKCECGVETRGRSGDVVTCSGCGLRYDTAEQARILDGVAGLTQRRFKLLGRIGIGVVGLVALLGLWRFSTPGLLVGGLGAAALWYGLVMRWMKARLIGRAASFAPTVTANRK